jgi:hypothetical protein
MSHGFSNTTRKPKGKARSGTRTIRRGQKKMSHKQIKNQDNDHRFFFGHQGVVHKEFVPSGQTVNQTFYREVLDELRRRVLRVRPEIAINWIFAP